MLISCHRFTIFYFFLNVGPQKVQSLAQRLAIGMTTPHALHWDILSRNFDVEHIDMILRHNVQYRGSLSGLPILVLLSRSERRQSRSWPFRSSSSVVREASPDLCSPDPGHSDRPQQCERRQT